MQHYVDEVNKSYAACLDRNGHFVPNIPDAVADFEIDEFTAIGLIRKAGDKAKKWAIGQEKRVDEVMKEKVLGSLRPVEYYDADGDIVQDDPMANAEGNRILLEKLARTHNIKAHQWQQEVESRPTIVDAQQTREAEENAAINEANGDVGYGQGVVTGLTNAMASAMHDAAVQAKEESEDDMETVELPDENGEPIDIGEFMAANGVTEGDEPITVERERDENGRFISNKPEGLDD
jgi:hypothetical protein